MKKKSFCLMLTLALISVASAQAQVVIGGQATTPHEGAILDLASGGQTNLGLLLPNVALGDLATDFALVANADNNVKQTATGMIVYNTANLTFGGKGIYVWDGNKWVPLSDPCPSPVYDSEGNDYTTGWFGKAGCWTTQNMRYKGALTALSDYHYPNKNENILDANPEYGLFYKWNAATGRSGSSDANGSGNEGEGPSTSNENHAQYRGICPIGWHVPSDREWNDLEEEIALSAADVYSANGPATLKPGWRALGFNNSNNTLYDRGDHGPKMKSKVAVNDDNTGLGVSFSRDKNGFDALRVGRVLYDATNYNADNYGGTAYFWSSSRYSDSNAWYRALINTENVGRAEAQKGHNLHSVRCKKN
ncbi:MAG: fibrobacter succinogenes major paralogous domain-containing protein [Dysgonamonadaceae bacterium]|jgi:uncharacterized protein (TIGR02145 family)|nr:fibrobacter succinogenes major paralogous domain-containing protein [Dysgonamonadaceae bacterium]